jgi:hypothetical protein
MELAEYTILHKRQAHFIAPGIYKDFSGHVILNKTNILVDLQGSPKPVGVSDHLQGIERRPAGYCELLPHNQYSPAGFAS